MEEKASEVVFAASFGEPMTGTLAPRTPPSTHGSLIDLVVNLYRGLKCLSVVVIGSDPFDS